MEEPAVPPLPVGRDGHPRISIARHAARPSALESVKLRQSNDNGIDPDTCRICRGEGTSEEPLFFPCKCSGSIKYVHQDCLMEWLSHSQKKHCELCKTPFRFTKLYSPQMPNTIPVHVFIGHVAKFLFRNLLVWLRAALVITVWLCWLPGLMRSVWSFLFWLSDEGLGTGSIWAMTGQSSLSRPDTVSGTSGLAPTCPASPLYPSMSAMAETADGLQEILRNYSGAPYSGSWRGVNITTNDAVSSAVMRATIDSLSAASRELEGTCTAVTRHATPRHSSLLSGVSFLQNLSRYPLVNRTVVNILEGQIITILVIVCFILVILVRDYVVQQQPEINMRAALEEVRLREERQRLMEQVEDLPEGPADNGQVVNPSVQLEAESVDAGNRERRDIRPTEPPPLGPDMDVELPPSLHGGLSNLANGRMPETNGPAARGVEPESPVATVHEYLRLYRQEGGDPRKILKAIEDENLEETMGYWTRVTRSMIEKQEGDSKEGEHRREQVHFASASSTSSVQATPPSAPHFTWPSIIPEAAELAAPESNGAADAISKGKEKEISYDESPEDRFFEAPAAIGRPTFEPPRPRAVSDGPHRSDHINPLANNSWSFNALPQQPPNPPAVAGPSSPAPMAVPADHLEISQRLDDQSTIASDVASAPTSRSVAGTDSIGIDTPFNDSPVVESHQNVEDIPTERPQLERGMMDRIADFMWRDVEAREVPIDLEVDVEFVLREDEHEHHDLEDVSDDEERHNLEDIPSEEGDEWQDMEDISDDEEDAEPEDAPADVDGDRRDPEVVEAAAAAGLDPDAVDDAEDIDGVLELIGMRGPIVGLFQNAVFCSVLVSVTIFICVFIPYNIGRFSIWSTMNPSKLLNMVFGLTKFVQDAVVALTASIFSGLLAFTYYIGKAFGWWLPSAQESCRSLLLHTWGISSNATLRVADTVLHDFPIPSSVDVPAFSAISHQALIDLKGYVVAISLGFIRGATVIIDGELPSKLFQASTWIADHRTVVTGVLQGIPAKLLNPSSWVISIGSSKPSTPVSMDLASWSSSDRFWAILSGYISLCAMGGLYLRRGSPFSSGPVAQEWEASLIDVLNQASGVMKVILIISIEMLVFPLYCGLLLDVALLPLFENATIKSRLAFTIQYPLTSIFVHWFVGTGYMFHFALFVSMCRKIMRKGVLYFIRDPDDPEFHPVRDVLERNVTTQLRKILFSAFVYGALVIVCLGGVVWGLSFSLPSVLPIHYSSNEPILEFPIDLLFYNFAMPLAVKFFRPSDGLHVMYTWWLRKCARFLRLSWFLFGERRIDEEGQLALPADSPHLKLPWWRRLFLELNKNNDVVPKTWSDLFDGGKAKPKETVSSGRMRRSIIRKRRLVRSGQLIKDGSFVRTPASDQVKVPKGRRVFLPVNEYGYKVNQDGTRNENFTDSTEKDAYTTSLYRLTYVPPNFRSRMFLFILLIWLFAAVTGVGFTIIPLIFGRRVFQLIIPAHVRTNDIYAFSIGVYILGSAAYVLFRARAIAQKTKDWALSMLDMARCSNAPRHIGHCIWYAVKIAYTYLVLLVVFPMILATLVELYLVLPMHTYINPPAPYVIPSATDGNIASVAVVPHRHTTHVIQSWTLGLLYVKIGARAITSFYRGTRAAHAVRAVLRAGWMRPDIAVLTRAFVIPGLLIAGIAICGPIYVTGILEQRGLLGVPAPAPHELSLIYRLSYPAAALSALAAAICWSILGVFSSWKTRIRDEAYLIGERLHNFGVTTAGTGSSTGGGSWRVRGARI